MTTVLPARCWWSSARWSWPRKGLLLPPPTFISVPKYFLKKYPDFPIGSADVNTRSRRFIASAAANEGVWQDWEKTTRLWTLVPLAARSRSVCLSMDSEAYSDSCLQQRNGQNEHFLLCIGSKRKHFSCLCKGRGHAASLTSLQGATSQTPSKHPSFVCETRVWVKKKMSPSVLDA